MKNRSILITGCSSGIGYCTANGLKNRGYRVFATARKDNDVETLRAQGLESLQLDLDDSSSIKSAVNTILEHTDGTLYAVFNNGAYGQTGAVEDLSRDAMRAQFETNLFGTQELINLIIPVMRRQGYGRIINNSSILGFVAMPLRGAYNASKYALEGMTDTLRLELHGSGIHVSLIEPGPIESNFRQNSLQAFRRFINLEQSIHRKTYEGMMRRLAKSGPVTPFTLAPEAVLKRVVHALESPRPKIRYYVTLPTYVFAAIRHLLPYRTLDKVLARAVNNENS